MTAGSPALRWRHTAAAYLALTKPRIIRLLLVTTVPTMIVAAGGVPDLALVLATLLGGALAAGGANAINCYADRDIDRAMTRTAHRPLVRSDIRPRAALWFGILLGTAAFVVLATSVNLAAAVLAVAALLFYVFVYTVWLKRRTTQNIVIGGAAGAVPVLVGWVAVTGTVGLPALVLFAIIVAWTPPHFWALAIRYRDDYAAVGVPMLPAVVGLAATARAILWYAIVLTALTLMFGVVGGMGAIYTVAAALSGGVLVVLAIGLLRDPSDAMAMRLFRYSISHLTVVFVAAAVDTLVAL